MIRKQIFSLTIASALALVSVAQATLLVDFQNTGNTTATGYSALDAVNQGTPTSASGSYSAFGSTVTVDIVGSNLPDGALDWRAVQRNGAVGDVYNDWIGADTRLAGTDVTLSITVSGLPAGSYNWLSYHHDGGAGTTNGNLDGLADYSFMDSSGVGAIVPNGIAFSRGDMSQPVSTLGLPFTITSGGTAQLDILMDNGQGDVDDTNSLFAYIGGLEITAVPEPGSTSLALVAAFGMFALIRRRK